MQGSESARPPRFGGLLVVGSLILAALGAGMLGASPPSTAPPVAPLANVPFPVPPELIGVDLNQQSEESVAAKSDSCVVCHQNAKDPHNKNTVRLGCTDCHGGNVDASCKNPMPTRKAGEPGACPAAPPAKNPEACGKIKACFNLTGCGCGSHPKSGTP